MLNWEAAYATAFQIQTSTDGTTWTTIYSTTTGTGGTQTLTVTGTGRYVRMNGTARATEYGYSLWEFQVFGDTARPPAAAAPPTPRWTSPATASSTENAGTPASRRRRRQHRHPLVQRVQPTRSGCRSTSARPQPICQVVLNWEAAYATAFQIQTSDRRHAPGPPIYSHHHRHRRHPDARPSPAPAATSG